MPFKTLLSSISMCLSVGLVAGLIAISPAAAQSPPKEILLTNNAGCKLYHSIGTAVIEAQLLNVAGNCVNGFFQGAVIYGIGWTINITDRPGKRVIGVRTGIMQQGRFEGLRMFMNENNVVGLSHPDRGTVYSSQKRTTGYSLAQLLDAINAEAIGAGGQNPVSNREQLTSIATLWDRNPEGMLSTYTQDNSNPRIAIANNIPAIIPQTNSTQDDPKVFGRSARGA
jgi:hypothetical protein